MFPFEVMLDGGEKETSYCWCQYQGKVINVINDKIVNVEWDTMPDVDGDNKKMIQTVELLPSNWKKIAVWRGEWIQTSRKLMTAKTVK